MRADTLVRKAHPPTTTTRGRPRFLFEATKAEREGRRQKKNKKRSSSYSRSFRNALNGRDEARFVVEAGPLSARDARPVCGLEGREAVAAVAE